MPGVVDVQTSRLIHTAFGWYAMTREHYDRCPVCRSLHSKPEPDCLMAQEGFQRPEKNPHRDAGFSVFYSDCKRAVPARLQRGGTGTGADHIQLANDIEQSAILNIHSVERQRGIRQRKGSRRVS